jgi:hypothetical protein
MKLHRLSVNELFKSIAIGIVTAILLSGVMVPALKFGISPLPKPLGLAFAETLAGRPLPLPAGLLFHVAYVTFWSIAFVSLFRDSLTLRNALILGSVLWFFVLIFFFPIVGWGFFGLAVSPKLIIASLVPHALFAVFLWGLCKLVYKSHTHRALQG